MNKKHPLFILVGCLLFFNIHSQNIQWHGNIESGIQYNGLISSFSPYPQTYAYFQSQQVFSFFEVPVQVNALFTNLPNGLNSKHLYPNFINISFNKQEFRKNIDKKIAQALRQKMDKQLFLNQQKQEKWLTLKQITMWTSQIDTNVILKRIDSLESISPKTDEALESIVLLEDQLKNARILFQKAEAVSDDLKKIEALPKDTNLPNLSEVFKIPDKDINKYLPLNRFQKLMLNFQKIDIGRFLWKTESQHISQGITMDGANIEFSSSHLNVNGIYGRVYPIVLWNQIGAYSGNSQLHLYGGSVGGKMKKHQITLGVWQFEGVSIYPEKHRNSLVHLNYQFQSSILNYKGEITGSQSYQPVNAIEYFQGIPIIANFSADNIFNNILQQRMENGLSTGFATNHQLQLNIHKILDQVKINYERISPFYQSYSAPFLMRDQQNAELSFQLKWNKGWQMNIGGFYREDNLSRIRSTTTQWQTYFIRNNISLTKHLNYRTEYKFIQRQSNVFIQQHQWINYLFYQASNRFIENIQLQFLVFQSSNFYSMYNLGNTISGKFNNQLQWTIQNNWINLYHPEQKNYQNIWQISTDVTYNWEKGNITPNILFYKNYLSDEWQYNASLAFQQEVFKNCSLKMSVGYGWLRYLITNFGWIDFSYKDYWHGQLQMNYRW